ncbi:glycosyltransferase [Staphylococcus capitis]
MKLIQLLLSLASVISLICGKFIYNRRHTLSRSKHSTIHSNELTVIIPARDEAQRLPNLLRSLTKQRGIYEIIVMDDASQDGTSEVAKAYGATVYETKEDSQWYGKSHACYQGAQHVQTPLMMFVDADVIFNSHAIEAILNSFAQQGNQELLSIQPYHETFKFYESLSAIFNLMTIVGMNRFSSLASKSNDYTAFGPVTIMNKEDYFKTGGHKNARNTIIEGFALGEAFSQSNLPITVYEGSEYVKFRMYEEGLRSLIQGWTKHFSVGANQTEPQVMLAIIMWLMGSLTSTMALLLGWIAKPISLIFSGIVYILYTWEFVSLHRRVGAFSIILLILHPILFVFFIIIFINSWRHAHFSKKVKWKGRTFDIS